MSAPLKEFLQRWIISTVAVLVATFIVPGIHFKGWPDLLAATFLLGILNTFLRPLLLFLSLPLLVFSLGLFTLVINAFLLYLVAWLIPTFHIAGFGHAFLAALVISIITIFLNSLTGTGRSRVRVKRDGERPPDDHDDGNGPVIDV